MTVRPTSAKSDMSCIDSDAHLGPVQTDSEQDFIIQAVMHVLPFKPGREENKTNSGMPEVFVLHKARLPGLFSATASWMNDSGNRTG